jgi:hypothetical protein
MGQQKYYFGWLMMIFRPKNVFGDLGEMMYTVYNEKGYGETRTEVLAETDIRGRAPLRVRKLVSNLENRVIRECMPQDSRFAEDGIFYNTVAEYIFLKLATGHYLVVWGSD